MQLFECRNCGQTLHFENTVCGRCGLRLGFAAPRRELLSLREDGGIWRDVRDPDRAWRFCANAAHEACNWVVPAGGREAFCEACRHNRTIPDLTVPGNLDRWRRVEAAKHRLVYSLLQLGLPLPAWWERAEGLAFEFLADPDDPALPRVMTGHASGTVTLNIAEADDAERESRRAGLGESYRTLLGHFRHEVGHWYWDRLVRDGEAGRIEAFRFLFGDERADYGEALARHYEAGPPPDWADRCISPYASAHPWEDFAETWAHYIHIVDTLGTAGAYGLRLRPRVAEGEALAARIDFDAYREPSVETLVEAWAPLTLAVNSLNRSMGLPDLYPFVLSAPVVKKLGFVHDLIRSARGAGNRGTAPAAEPAAELAGPGVA